MKAWAKRMIWFFGYMTFHEADKFIELNAGTYTPADGAASLVILCIIVIPMLCMEDD